MKNFQVVPTFLLLTLATVPTFGQSADNWRRFDNQAGSPAPQTSSSQLDSSMAQSSPDPYPQAAPQQNNNPAYNSNGGYQGGQYPQPQATQGAMPAVPEAFNMAAGKYLTVRLNSFLTTDHNQPGDAFTATLVEPLVVDGFVVAQRGQMVNGRVVDVEKAGRVKGVSSMRIELTGITLVDGQQLQIKTQLMNRKGQTSNGRDASAVIGTTALGTIVGAAATGTGFGAGMGAIGGAVVGTVGVLVTRGRPTVITPESVMTFRVEQPISISTVRSAGAFYPVAREDYGHGGPNGPSYAERPSPVAGAYPIAPYPSYGSFWGPSIYVGGFGGYYRSGFYGRGYYGRGYRGRR